MTSPTIAEWIASKVIRVSNEEIIEKYRTFSKRTSSAKTTRAKLSIHEQKKGKPIPIVSLQQSDGLWQDRVTAMRWHLKNLDRAEKYFVCCAVTRLTYMGWKNSKEMAGFLRIGPQGVYFLFPNNDNMTIAEPPLTAPPPSHVSRLVVGPNGFLCEQREPNPDVKLWQPWAHTIDRLTHWLRDRVALMGDRVDVARIKHSSKAFCGGCGVHAAKVDPEDSWRAVEGTTRRMLCQACANDYGQQVMGEE